MTRLWLGTFAALLVAGLCFMVGGALLGVHRAIGIGAAFLLPGIAGVLAFIVEWSELRRGGWLR